MIRSPEIDTEWIKRVAAGFGLGTPRRICLLGGTSSPKYRIDVSDGTFVVRVRGREFEESRLIEFDHASLTRLADAGLPVPRPLRRPNGTTWLYHDGRMVEVLTWIDGEPYRARDEKAIYNLGVVLARFHQALADAGLEGKAGLLREDHPDLLMKYTEQLRVMACTCSDTWRVDELASQLEFVKQHLDRGLYESLPKTIIHGDIHPGNIRFRDSRVSAIYDFDYLGYQARVRDLVDALMFFAADRDEPLRPDDIRSLTQPFRPCLESARILFRGYQENLPLTDLEWQAVPLLMRSQWLQIRLRGSRKVKQEDRLAFVLDGYFRVSDWLDEEAVAFVNRLQWMDRPVASGRALP